MLAEMAARGMAPKALLFNRVNPIMVQGAAFAGIAMVDRFEVDLTDEIRTGDRLVVDPGRGTVELRRQE
jgi:predicted aconitase with swiveling domain